MQEALEQSLAAMALEHAEAAPGPPSDDAGDNEGALDHTPAGSSTHHRACSWKDPLHHSNAPIRVLRATQSTWAEDHPEHMIKWRFPTMRRDCIKISFRSIEKIERCCSPEYHTAINTVLSGFPHSVVRVVSSLGLNYLHPHHKLISQQGRHLLMVKVYEAKREAHCWFIPLNEVLASHAQTSEALKTGISLNDVQLVQTYDVANVFALHAETFVCSNAAGGHANTYGECNWIGGMAFHAAAHSEEAFEKAQAFALVPDEEMEGLAAKHAQNREKKARKKANQKAKKEQEAAAAAAEARRIKQEEEAQAAAERKAGKLQVHESLVEALAKGRLLAPT